MSILVSTLSHVADLVARRQPGRVISALDPDGEFPVLGPRYAGRHLRLAFHDAHAPALGVTPPSPRHITELLAFLDRWDASESLLVHCRAGIGRSTAIAYVSACYRNPGASELEIASALRRAAPLARPNETIVRLADAAMRREGRMASAIVETGRGLGWILVNEGFPFEMPSRFHPRTKRASDSSVA
jgi:predicted protein tyrosine phosphatase